MSPFFPAFSGNTTSVHTPAAVDRSFSAIVTDISHSRRLYYIISSLINHMLSIIVWIIAFAIAITVHEASHAATADRLGDPSARLAGRLTLNPIKHYDPVGTTLLLILVIMRSLGLPVIPFGWAKPVPVDPYNLANPRRDSALISIAGPLSNIALAAILAGIIRVFPTVTLLNLLFPVILLNVALAIFNLIPIHPLDGGKVLVGLLPIKDAREVDLFLGRYGMFLLLVVIFPIFNGVSIISSVIAPAIGFIVNLLLPGISTI